jgi:hypothetical protein
MVPRLGRAGACWPALIALAAAIACHSKQAASTGGTDCVATTCAKAGAQCGAIADGCGGTLDCGGCPQGQTCGGAGAANICGTPAVAAGSTRWVLDLGGAGDEYVAALGVRDDGVIVAVTAIGGEMLPSWPWTPWRPDALGLVWISPAGQIERTRTFALGGTVPFGPHAAAVSPHGDVFLQIAPACANGGCPDLGAGPITSPVLVKLSPDGDPVWAVPEIGEAIAGADGAGGLAVTTVPVPIALVKISPDGVRDWSWTGLADAADISVAFDSASDAVVGQALIVARLDAGGHELWTGIVSPDAFANRRDGVGAYAVRDVALTGSGDVVAAGVYSQPLIVDGGTLPLPGDGGAGVFLAAFSGGDGTLRWARAAGGAGPLAGGRYRIDVAAAPDGSIALAVGTDACDLRIERWMGDGTRLWSRLLRGSCATDPSLAQTGFGVAPGGDVVVGGAFEGPVDFGTGPVAGKGGLDGFVLDLAP